MAKYAASPLELIELRNYQKVYDNSPRKDLSVEKN